MKKFKMNIGNRLLSSALFLGMITMLFPSCLKKGDSFASSGSATTEIVELGSTQSADSYSSVYQGFSLSGKFVNDTAGFYVIVKYAGASETAPQDITLTLALDTAALTAYNTDQGTTYAALRSNMVSFSKTVTISKGTDLTRIRVLLNDTTGMDFDSTYALPLTISTTTYGTISANTGTKIFAFTPQNIYDGIYTVTGTMTDAVLTAATGKYPKTVYLVSTGAASNLYEDYSTNSLLYPRYYFLNGTTTTYFGNFCPIFTFSGTKVTAVTNYYGQGTNTSVRSAVLNSSGINTVTFASDGVTPATIKVSYYMVQSGVYRTSITEVYTFSSAR